MKLDLTNLNLNQGTLVVLAFGILLVVFLIVLIAVTVKVLKEGKSGGKKESEEDFDEDSEEDSDGDEKDSPDSPDSDSDGIEDMVRQVTDAVNAAKEENLQKTLEQSLKEEEDSEEESSEDEDSEDEVDSAEPTQTMDSVKIEKELLKSGHVPDSGSSEKAREKAQSPEYDAAKDSAFGETEEEPEEVSETIPEEKKPAETGDEETQEEKISEEETAEEEEAEEETEEAEEPETDSAAGEEKPAEELTEETRQEEASPAEETEEPEESSETEEPAANVKSGTEKKPGGTVTVNPANQVKIGTVNAPEAGNGTDAAAVRAFMKENPTPKKKKKKIRKKDEVYEEKFAPHGDEIKVARYFWYNNQDIENLTRKEDMYFYCHYFEKPDQAVIPLITEMYDCAFVRTEEIQKIAYGIDFHSIGMKKILQATENISFDKTKATKMPSKQDRETIYQNWCGYVDNFLKIIVIHAPEEIYNTIRRKMYAYGHQDVDTLLYSPE